MQVNDIRVSSRIIVRELGFLGRHIAGANLSASAVHALVELGNGTVSTISALAHLLKLEKSTVSRLIKGLIEKGLITSHVDDIDARTSQLKLTKKGMHQLQEIEIYAQKQVSDALLSIPSEKRKNVKNGLMLYAEALQSAATVKSNLDSLKSRIKIISGPVPGLLGRIVEMHGTFYSANHGFGINFESLIAQQVSEFLGRINKPLNVIYCAEINGKLIGSIAVDGEDLGAGIAHIRWFIVDDDARGNGIGSALFSKALGFIDKAGFKETRLWTFKGLDAARHLYEQEGFSLNREKVGNQWGSMVMEQLFSRNHT